MLQAVSTRQMQPGTDYNGLAAPSAAFGAGAGVAQLVQKDLNKPTLGQEKVIGLNLMPSGTPLTPLRKGFDEWTGKIGGHSSLIAGSVFNKDDEYVGDGYDDSFYPDRRKIVTIQSP